MTAAESEDWRSNSYLELFRHPGVIRIALSSVVARLPFGMTTVLLVLLFHAATGSYAVAGAAVAVNSIALAATSPWFGRLSDRGHARRVLIIVGCLQPISMLGLVASVHVGWPILVSIGFAAISGAAFPPISAMTRERWSFVLPSRLHRTAYGLEALLSEILYILGPLLAALGLLFAGPGFGLLASSICVAIGSTLLAFTPAMRAHTGVPKLEGAKPRLWTPKVVAILGVGTSMGAAFGLLEVAIPAFAIENGGQAFSALLLAVWSSASVIGGLIFIRVRTGRSIEHQLVVLVSLNVIGFVVLGLSGSILMLAILLAISGIVMAPALTVEYNVVAKVAPDRRVTETFTWLNTGSYVGGAAGSLLGGALIAPLGVNLTLSAASAIALVAVVAAACTLRLAAKK
jgi:MFS family permease